MPASGLGKIKMASQVTAILLLILGWERVPLLVTLGQGGDVGGARSPRWCPRSITTRASSAR